MAVPIWAQGTGPVFTLTAPFLTFDSRQLEFNVQLSDRLYLLDGKACSFVAGEVRATKYNVPQGDGSILPKRFLTGATMELSIAMLEARDKPACDDLLVEMLDDLLGAFRSLLNAGDNEGRVSWQVAGKPNRMLDDVRLLVYPKHVVGDAWDSVTVTIDSKYPYAEDLTQSLASLYDGAPQTLTNNGNADFLPVFQVNRFNGVNGGSDVDTFTILNITTGAQVVYNSSQAGAGPIPGGHYAELSTFDNTFYEDGDQANEMAGIAQLDTLFFPLIPGDNEIQIDGCDMDVLYQAAWG